jgi:hypothetical protein
MRASNIDYSIREDVIALDWNLPANELFPDEESSKKIVRSGGAHIKLEDIGPVRPQIDRAIRILQGVWSEPIDLSIERIQVRQVNFYRPPALDWVLTMTHRSTIASS